MKNSLLLLLLLLSAWGARAQTTLAQESFETDGEGTRYVSNSFDNRTSVASVAGAFPYFTRALTNPLVNPFNTAYVSFGTNAYPVTIGGVTGSVFWASEAVESTATNPNPATDRPAGVVTLNPINASNYSGLTMTVALADARGPSSPTITQGGMNPQYETNDYIRLQYSTDGGATYNTIGQFVGNNSLGNGTGYMQLDVDKDGAITSLDGAQSAINTLDINMRSFSFSIPGSPGALLVRVQIDQRGASEELAFDNIRVAGTPNTTAPPVLANIESTSLSYAEGQAATQITSSLTVTNAAGNLTGGNVTISSGRVSTQDVLIFTNQNGITGSFSTGTGVLTLSGSASAATYQAALRSVAYQNTNTTNATAGTRTIQFVVANGSVTSSIASRNVVVTTALNSATALPYQEEFTNDGEGTRYASNTFTNSPTGAAWLRTTANPYQTSATSQTPTTFSGISNSYYWYGNNTNATANPSRIGTLQTLPINTAGYANLNFSLLLGASSGANASWQTADYFRVSYRVAGSGGAWVPLIQFRGSSAVVAGQGNMQRDADPNAAPGSAAPTGTTLTPALASFSAALPSAVYGQTLEFQLVQSSDDIRAELAFDNLQLTGTLLAAPTVTTAAATSITTTSAVLGGSVSADGGAAVTDRGVVYGTSTNPVIGGTGVTRDANGSGTGSYSKTIAGLTPGTTYYVRAYGTNSVGTSYGAQVSFTTAATTATVTTAAPTSVTGTSAVLGGSVTADGGTNVTERGVVYVAGASLPTTSNIKEPNGSGIGSYAQTVAGLRGNTLYTVRAYAINSAGTAYGASQTFTTPNNPPTANADAVTVAEDSGPTVINVLANDTSTPDINETLTVTAVTQPANGTATLASGVVSFAPALNFNGTTTFTYTIADGNGGTATATVTVTVTPVNDAPVVTTTAGSTTFTPGAGAVAVDNGLTVTDVDNPTLASATVSIGTGFVSSQDALRVTVNSGVTGIYTFSTGMLTLTGTATVAQYQAILRSVTYNNSSATPNTATRTLSFTANDGSLTSAVATKNVTFAATTTVVSITQNGPSPTNASTVAYTVTFANAVTGVSTGNFAASTTNLTGASVTSITGSGTTYIVTLSTGTLANSSASGSIQLQFNNSTGVSPTVTNPGFNGPAYVIDRTAPVATISTTAASPTSASPIPFTVTFSEAVTGFSASGITVTNGTITTALTSAGNAYSFSVTPTATGAVTVRVAANAAQDAAGNGNPAAGPLSVTYAAPVTATTWTGTISTDWYTAGNWSAGVPTASIDATIPAGTAFAPAIASGTAPTRALTLSSGATLLMSGGTLDAQGTWTNNGNFAATGGTVQLGAQAGTIVGSSLTTFWNLTTSGNNVSLATSAGLAVRRVLTTNTNLQTNGNPLTLLSDANGTAMTVNPGSAGVIGTSAQVQRYIGPAQYAGPAYRHLSSPTVSLSNTTGTQFGDLATPNFVPQVNPAYNSSATPTATQPFPNIFGYDQSRLVSTSNNLSAFDKGYYSPATLSDRLSSGFGYTVNIAANQTVTFKGSLGNGDLSRSLSRNAAGSATDADAGWQLLGNPYPSPYDYSKQAAADRTNLDEAIYIFESTSQYSGNYRAYINGVGGNPILAMGQAFFARVSAGQTSGSITYRNANRVTTYQNPTFQRTAAETRPLVQLTLRGTAASAALLDEAAVYFEPGATTGFEPAFDAEKLANPSGLNISISLASGRQLSIDGQPALGTAQRVVPLAVGVPAAGTYSLQASQLLNLSTVPAYLRDLQTGALIDLAQQPTYQFSVSNASALLTGRFELVFSPQRVLATAPAALAQQVALYPNPATTSAWLELPASLGRQAITAMLVDAVGRTVRIITLPAQGAVAHQLDLHQLATGIYALRLNTSVGVVVKKLVVE